MYQPIGVFIPLHQSRLIAMIHPVHKRKNEGCLSSYHSSYFFQVTMSSSTTKKFREFMAEPLGDKGIRDVPGIGDVLGTKLSEAGYEKVRFSIEIFYFIEFIFI
jgi:isopentenyl diphosphate isomerase/L-lactate dehydrogenase-like FMN-dependent dehydrogenase